MMEAGISRCLWIARELPFPLDSGDRIYSASLVRSLAAAGAEVHFVGLESDSFGLTPSNWGITWHPVPGRRRPYSLSVFSRYPLAAASHATAAYRRKLRELLDQPWDAVIFDHFGSGWAFAEFGGKVAASSPRPIMIHISHNYETALARSLVTGARQNPLRKLALWQNYLKILAMERRLVRGVDLLTTITGEDAAIYSKRLGARSVTILTPGYSGPVRKARVIDASCPRRVILVGSFRWVVKQENLRQFIRIADPVFAAAGIALDVVGVVPADLQAELSAQTHATCFHGFVDDLEPLFDKARIALVPEVIGGGFKLKFLDYVFSRVPVASLSNAVAGLSPRLVSAIVSTDDLESLATLVVATIDDDEHLNALQEAAFDIARTEFDWNDRGDSLLRTLSTVRASRQPLDQSR